MARRQAQGILDKVVKLTGGWGVPTGGQLKDWTCSGLVLRLRLSVSGLPCPCCRWWYAAAGNKVETVVALLVQTQDAHSARQIQESNLRGRKAEKKAVQQELVRRPAQTDTVDRRIIRRDRMLLACGSMRDGC